MKPFEFKTNQPVPSALNLMPSYKKIPDTFKDYWNNPWGKLTEQWFFNGLTADKFFAKEEIDKTKALRHLSIIMQSRAPKHEHKISGVSYLMSLWFEPAFQDM